MPHCAYGNYGNYTGTGAVASGRRRILACLPLLVAACVAQRASAQALGSVAADRARIDSLWNAAPAAPRAASALGHYWQPVLPDVRLTWNSDIPFSLNDGPLWAGRGTSMSVTAGVAAGLNRGTWGVGAVAAPTFVYSANGPFDIAPGRAPGRSVYSSPWHLDSMSADLPMRFGDQPLKAIGLGESKVALRYENVVAGVSNTSEWWGPSIRNALVLSNNAGGIPRGFVQTAHPIRTRFGDLSAEALLGTLTESLFFDTVTTNNYRSIGGFLVSFRPAIDSGLSLGVSRMVYTPATSATPSLHAAADLLRWRPTVSANDHGTADQVASLFADWRFPGSGLEVYGELARQELPRSLGEFLRTPLSTGGYTLGLQWAQRRADGSTLRAQAEATFLDQFLYYRSRPPLDFYTGRAAPQGYTQRGQVLGAGIGPGGSSQWGALDYMRASWQLGVFAERIRWEEDAIFRQQFSTFLDHDVTMRAGVRGAWRMPMFDASAELSTGRRLDYLFQSGYGNPGRPGPVDLTNITLGLRLSPR